MAYGQQPQKVKPPQVDDVDDFLSRYTRRRVQEEARKQGLPADYADRQARAESAYDPNVITGRKRSKAGAVGTMQLMPGTAKDLGVNPYDIDANIEAGVRYSKQMMDRYGGDHKKAAAAYNWGMGNVEKKGLANAPAETRAYQQKVAGGRSSDDVDDFLSRWKEPSPTPTPTPNQPAPFAKLIEKGYGAAADYPTPATVPSLADAKNPSEKAATLQSSVGYYDTPSVDDPNSPVGRAAMPWAGTDTDDQGRETGAGLTHFKSAGVAPKPKYAPSKREKDAIRVVSAIDASKRRALELFKQADAIGQQENLGGVDTGRVDNSRSQQLRQQAESALEQANMYARGAQERFGDLVEVGFGKDSDPNSKRQWAYAKPKSTGTWLAQDQQRLQAHDDRLFQQDRSMDAAKAVRRNEKLKQDAAGYLQESEKLAARGETQAAAAFRKQAEDAAGYADELAQQDAAKFGAGVSLTDGQLRAAHPDTSTAYDQLQANIRRREDIGSAAQSYRESNPLSQYAQRLSTQYLGDRPDATPEDLREVDIRREAMGMGDRTAQTPGLLSDLGARLARGRIEMIPSAASGIANLADTAYARLNRATGNRLPEAAEWSPVVEPIAREFSNTIAPFLPTDTNRDKDFVSDVASGLGSAAGFASGAKLLGKAGLATKPAVGVLGVGAGIDEAVKQARAAGFDPAQDPARWERMVAMAGASGLTEIFGVGNMLDKWGLRRAFLKRAIDVAEEGGQEALQTFLGNVNAAYVGAYDQERKYGGKKGLGEDVIKNALVGAIVGGGTQAADVGLQKVQDYPVQQAARATQAERAPMLGIVPTAAPGPTNIVPIDPRVTQAKQQAAVAQPVAPTPEVAAPVAEVAARLGVDPAEAQQVVNQTVAEVEAETGQIPPEAFPLLPESEKAAIMRKRAGRAPGMRDLLPLEVKLNDDLNTAATLLQSPDAADQAKALKLLNKTVDQIQQSEGYLGEVKAGQGGQKPAATPYGDVKTAIQKRLKAVEDTAKQAKEAEKQAERMAKLEEMNQQLSPKVEAEEYAQASRRLTQQEQQAAKAQKETAQRATYLEKYASTAVQRGVIPPIEAIQRNLRLTPDEATAFQASIAERIQGQPAQTGALPQAAQTGQIPQGSPTDTLPTSQLPRQARAVAQRPTFGEGYQTAIDQFNTLIPLATRSLETGRFPDARSAYNRQIEALKTARANVNRRTADGAGEYGRLGSQIEGIQRQLQNLKQQSRQAAKQANAPTVGLAQGQAQQQQQVSGKKQQASAFSGPVESVPLLRPEAVQNPEGGIPEMPEQTFTGRMNRGIAKQEARQAKAKPGKRLITRIAELGGIDERHAGELRDVKDARRIGVIVKKPTYSPDVLARQLASEGYDIDPENLDTLWEAARRDVVGQERAAGTAEINKRLAAEEAEYNERQQAEAEAAPTGELKADTAPESEEDVEMASLRRAIERSEQENPRAYAEQTRPAEPGAGGVSFSPYADMIANNKEKVDRLYGMNMTTPRAQAIIGELRAYVVKNNIELRHFHALLDDIANAQIREAGWRDRGVTPEAFALAEREKTLQYLGEQETQVDRQLKRAIANAPISERERLELEVAAIDDLATIIRDDPDMMTMFDEAVSGDQSNVEDFVNAAGKAYGFAEDTARSLVEGQRQDYRTRQEDQRRAVSTQRKTAAAQATAKPAQQGFSNQDLRLLTINLSTIQDKDFDAYLRQLEEMQNQAVRGDLFGGRELTRREMGGLITRIKETRAERTKRVKDERLPALNEQRATPLPAKWKEGFGRQLVEQAGGQKAEPEGAAKTVNHPNPLIDGKEIIRETEDGRVIVANPDNKTGISVVKPQPETEVSADSLPAKFAQAFRDGQTFASITEARKVAAEFLGHEIKSGTQETKQIDEAIELGVVLAAREIVTANKANPFKAYDALVDLYNRQPNLAVRTSTSVEQQAYSTPIPIAYLADVLAGVNANTTVYEPTAGNGALLIAANPKNVTANELNPDRANALREQGFSVQENDAAAWSPESQVDRVVANPPFGAVKDDKGVSRRFKFGAFETTEIDHAIALRSLEAMKDDGRAVLILGGVAKTAKTPEARSDAYNGAAKRRFYYTLYNQYNVADHFTVSGDMYTKQGAGWPVDVIVIEGRGKSARALPAADVPRVYESYTDLKNVLNAAVAQKARVDAETQFGTRSDSRAARPDTEPGVVSGVSSRPATASARQGTVPGRSGAGVSAEAGGRGAAVGQRDDTQRGDQGKQPAPSVVKQHGADAATGRQGATGKPGSAESVQRPDAGSVGRPSDSPTGRTSELEGVFDEEFDKLFAEEAAPAKPSSTAELNKLFGQELEALSEQEKTVKPKTEKPSLAESIKEYQIDLSSREATKEERQRGRGPFIGYASTNKGGRLSVDTDGSTAQEAKANAELMLKQAVAFRLQKPSASEQAQKPAPVESIKEAAKSSTAAFNEAAKGIFDLFSDSSRLGSGLAFDEKTYAKAKPHFEAAYSHLQSAIKNVQDAMGVFIKHLNQKLGMTADAIQRMKPYIVQFIKEKTGAITAAQTETKTETAAKSEAKPAVVAQPKAKDSETHRAYQPISKARSVDTLVPVNMATPARNALLALEKKVGGLDEYVAEKLGYDPSEIEGYFSAEQVDALALAIDNIEKGSGYIAGHQTGIGKGRVVAGIIRYAQKTGKTPIFVTEKPSLYGDMIRDLTDIGMPNAKPLITNAAEKIPLDDEATIWANEAETARAEGRRIPPRRGKFLETPDGKKQELALKSAMRNGLKATGHDVVFTTYSQMQKIKGQSAVRHEALEHLAKGGVVIFDESHNAGGGQPKIKDGEIVEDRAQFARKLARNASAVAYSSATYAKRPEVMDLYFKTDLSKAVEDISKLADVINRGGIPLQQVTAAMLTEAGQYTRLERSFDGVSYDTVAAPVDKKAAEDIASILSGVTEFDRARQSAIENLEKELKAVAGIVSKKDNALEVEGANFTQIMHNVIDQMLLNLKADIAADTAIKAIKAGERPVITVSNTMGAFLEDFTSENDIKSGDPLNLDFRQVLRRYLERSRRVTIKNPDGTKEHYYLEDGDLSADALALYRDIGKQIDDAKLDNMLISPIDRIHQRLRDAGYKTAEITGRGLMVDYSGKVPVFKTRPSSETSTIGKKRAINGFNDGSIDALILNQSGSTGISLHASEKFKDQRRRHMVIAQAEKNIDTHMQMLGRVHRTGQVIPPRYTQLAADIPAEKRPAAVLAKKMASLNANTTAARGSAVTAKNVVDFLNKFGDEVAASALTNNPELERKLAYPKITDEDGAPLEGAMRKLTGRIPLLPIAEQEAIYEQLEDEYTDTITRLEAMGINTLEAKTLDLQAETLESEALSAEKPGDSPFTKGSELERVRIRRLGKSLSSAEVAEMVGKAVGFESTNFDELQAKGEAKLKETIAKAEQDHSVFTSARLMKLDQQIADTEKLAEQADDKKKASLMRMAEADRLRRAAVESESKKEVLKWRTLVKTLHPGAQVALKTDEGVFYGVVTDLTHKADTKNPLALGGWRVNLAVADAARSLGFPLSQVTTESLRASDTHKAGMVAEYADSVPIYDAEKQDIAYIPLAKAFDLGQSESTEVRQMATGNILAAFSALNSKGQIVNYTDKEGNVRQGILLPKTWNKEKELAKRDAVFTEPSQAIQFINQHNEKVHTRDDGLVIGRDVRRTEYVISANAAKSKGGKYYLNNKIRSIVGKDFVKAGNVMRVGVSEETARKVMDALYSGDALGQPTMLMAAGSKEKAREIIDAEAKRQIAAAEGKSKIREQKTSAARSAYDAAIEEFRAESRKFTDIQKRYRAREIGDNEFFAGRSAFDAASNKMDVAESAFVAAEPEEPVASDGQPSNTQRTLFRKGNEPTAADALTEAKIQFKAGKRGQAGTLYANDMALHVIRAAYEQSHGEQRFFENVNMNKSAARKIAAALTAEAQSGNWPADMQRSLRRTAREFGHAAQSGETVSIVKTGSGRGFGDIKTSRRHELFHDAQENLENSKGFLARHEHGQKLIDSLADMGYEPQDRTVEAAAFVASGEAGGLGLTDEQGKAFLKDYFDDIVATNGREALERFVSLSPKVQDALKEARAKNDIQGKTGKVTEGKSGSAEAGRLGANGEAARSGERIPGGVREQKRSSFGNLTSEPTGEKALNGYIKVYHGTNSEFDKPRAGSWFTVNPQQAAAHGRIVREFYIKPRNPVDLRKGKVSPFKPSLGEPDFSIHHKPGFHQDVSYKSTDAAEVLTVAEFNQKRRKEPRASFGALSNEPTGEVLGVGLGGLQKMFGRRPNAAPSAANPKTKVPLPKDFNATAWSEKFYRDAMAAALNKADRADYDAAATAREKNAVLLGADIDAKYEDRIYDLIDRVNDAADQGDGAALRKAVQEASRITREKQTGVRKNIFETIGAGQAAVQLATPGFVGRNILQHASSAIQSGLSDRLASAIDASFSAVTRTPRTIKETGNPVGQTLEGLRNYKQGLKEGWQKHQAGVDLGSGKLIDLEDLPDNKVANAFRELLFFINDLPDAGNYLARYERALKSLVKADERNQTPMTEARMAALTEQAKLEADHASLRDDNFVSHALKHLKTTLNHITSPVTGTDKFGLGDFVVKYTQVPGALVKRSIEYSPLGLVEAGWRAQRAVRGVGSDFERRNAIQALSRAVTGTGSTLGMGAAMFLMGILVPPEKEDYTSEQLERARGVRGFSVNLSALARLAPSLLSGEGFKAATKIQNGDKLVPIDWVQPWAMGASVGATLAEDWKEGKLSGGSAAKASFRSLSNALEIMGDQSVLKNLREYLRAAKGKTFTEIAGNVTAKFVKSAPQSFAPGITRQIGGVIDPKVRDYRPESRKGIPNALIEGLKRTAAGTLPGLSMRFPEKTDPITGQTMKTAQGERTKIGRILSLLSPQAINEYKADKLRDEIIRLNDYLEEKDINLYVPPLSSAQTKIKGYEEPTSLLRQREAQFAKEFAERGRRLVENPRFAALPDDAKADMLRDVISDIRQKTYKSGTKLETLKPQYKQPARRP